MAKLATEKSFLSLAGEYAVCSELQKLGVNCSLTYGNQKATDVIVLNETTKQFRRIEVKTSRSKRFVTGFFQKYYDERIHPDYWVIVYIDENNRSHFYIMTHQEMGDIQMERNKMTEWHRVEKGCDTVELKNIEMHKNMWDKIIEFK